jgi:hypothetical protein
LITPVSWSAAFVFVVFGAAKLHAADEASAALRAIRLPSRSVRPLAAGEVLTGLGMLIWAGSAAWLLGSAAYLALAGASFSMRRADLASCGCLGRTPMQPSAIHTVACVGFAALCLAAARSNIASVPSVAGADAAAAAVACFMAAAIVVMVIVVLIELPRTFGTPSTVTADAEGGAA